MSTPSPEIALLELERRLRACRSGREVGFVAVNDTAALLRFEQAVLLERDALGRLAVGAVSGLGEAEAASPYGQWLAQSAEALLAGAPGVRAVTAADLPAALAADWPEFSLSHALLAPLAAADGKVFGALWFVSDQPFGDRERGLAQWIAEAAAFALWSWRRRRWEWLDWQRWSWRRWSTRTRWIVGAAVAAAILFPVRLSALAPAEIVPAKPLPIAAPMDGVVERIAVTPNQPVKAGELLLVIDDTAARNKLAVALKSLEISRADFARATNKAFSDDPSKAEVLILDARVKERAAEVAYLTELVERAKLTAPADGIAIFADADDWRGRPVQTGERVMTVADPKAVLVSVFLSPDDAIQLETGGRVKLFLNAKPLSSFAGRIVQTSYETMPTTDGAPAYLVKAKLDDDEDPPRIGLKGTAKVYGGWVPLSYYLLRRPLGFLRRAVGI